MHPTGTAGHWLAQRLRGGTPEGRASTPGEVLGRTSEPRLPGVATASPTPAEALGACCPRGLGEAVYLQEPF